MNLSNRVFSLFCFCIFSINIIAQDNCQEQLDKCIPMLGKNIFLKSFVEKLGEKFAAPIKKEYPIILSKNTFYTIAVADENIKKQKFIVTVYNKDRSVVGSSFDKKTNKFFSTISFNCAITSLYYFEFTTEDPKCGCGACAIGFDRQMDADDYLENGISEMNIADYVDAIEHFNNLINLRPNDDAAFNWRGQAKLKSGEFKGAVEDFNSAIKINQDEPDYFFGRASAKLKLKDLDGACKDFKQAQMLGSNEASVEIRNNCK